MLQGNGYQVIGVTVGGPAPLGFVQLELEPGVTALYGRNGSGKTRLLRAIAEATSGIEGDRGIESIEAREVLVRIDPSHLNKVAEDNTWLADLEASLRQSVLDIGLRRPGSLDPWETDAVAMLMDSGIYPAAHIRTAIELRLQIEDNEFLEKIRDAGLVTIQARESGLTCGPAVDFDTMANAGYDTFLWDTIEFVDRVIAKALGVSDVELQAADNFNIPTLFAERMLDDRAVNEIMHERYAHEGFRETWNAYPIDQGGALPSSPIHVVGWRIDGGQVDSRTAAVLSDNNCPLIEAMDSQDVIYSEPVLENLRKLEQRSNQFLSMLLLDAPMLRFNLGSPESWIEPGYPCWEARDGATGQWIGLADLSNAQIRWTHIAIELAIGEISAPDRPVLLLIDEPEAALHRASERHLVAGLKLLATELGGASVLVATHSPAFLRDAGVRSYHIHRSKSGKSIASEADVVIHDPFERETWRHNYGLDKGDLLSLVRTFVVVEGAHDQAALEHIARNELIDGGAAILRMRGARNAPAIAEARILMTMSDARVLVVVDNVIGRKLEKHWRAVRDAAEANDRGLVKKAIETIGRLPGGEAGWLAELAEHAVDLGRIDRITVFGLSQPDIIYYFDPSIFKLAEPWSDLSREWRTLAKSDRPDFKSWLRSEKGASISTAKIRKAAGALKSYPDDLEELRHVIATLGLSPTAP